MAHIAINEPFSPFGASSKKKLLLLGSPVPETELADRARSLHIEHVSPSCLMQREISRSPQPAPSGPRRAEAALALLRRWFFSRKPDAGFLLTGFPATLLHARVFDEWLDARNEALDAVFAAAGSADPVAGHYDGLGLLAGPFPFPPAGTQLPPT
jgi:adenylate kinase